MLPLFDENPTARKPIVTWLLIAISIALHLVANINNDAVRVDLLSIETAGSAEVLPDDLRFSLQWAAVPCEITEQRPLRRSEIADTYFETGDPLSCNPDATDDPLFPGKQVLLAVISSMFLHSGPLHLGLNMLFLWVFGNNVEDRLGHLGFGAFYLVAGIVATGVYVLTSPSSTVAILGASGAVAGVMGSYLVWFPDAPIRTVVFLVLVDIRARWFLIAWFGIQFFTWTGPGAWIAHVAGFVFGVAAGRFFRKYLPRFRGRGGLRITSWDETGGAGHGPYPHLDEVWNEPHHDHYHS